jgi:glutamate--cysteine ligase
MYGTSTNSAPTHRPGLHAGVYPTITDWSNHLGALWPEVRVRRWMEMRGADAGPWRMVSALPALWTGLLYDEDAFSEAQELVQGWSLQDIAQLRTQVGGGGGQCVVAAT